jgi:ATP-dependent exoDNAse (exonuclease V) beta subunit
VVTTISERLETTLRGRRQDTDAALQCREAVSVEFVRYPGETDTRHQLAQSILSSYKNDSSASRAVIARNHRQLLSLLPHLQAAGIPLRYELQENCLDSEPVQQLELVSRVVMLISQGAYDEANELLPELLSHPAWAIPAKDLWRLGVNATQQRRYWLEEMLQNEGKLQSVAEWLIVMAHLSLSTPLETMIDTLFGVGDSQSADESSQDEQDPLADITEELVSPYRAYFFPSEGLDTTPTQYVVWLHTLQQLRAKLRDYRSDNTLRLTDFVRFIDMHRDAGIRMQAITNVEHDATAVTLLTAHKSKGLEFDEVYILDASEHVWGEGARSRGKLIQFPSNMPLSPAGENADERLRLLFVAITRARRSLTFVTSQELDNGKAILPVAVLSHESFAITDLDSTIPSTIDALRNDWKLRVIDVDLATKEQILRPLLDRYKLSATHLNNFLNIPSGGPELFLLHNLLRFPQAMSPSAAYGSAIHTSLQRAHAHLSATGKKRPVEDILNDFEAVLAEYQLTDTEQTLFTGRGTSALTAFLDHTYDSFSPSQVVERSFSGEVIMAGDARITGAIDLLDIDDKEKTIFITDYKTGKAASSWRGTSDYEKIKLHHYEQQLMMYKLLIEGSEQFLGYTVTGGRISFVEPAVGGNIVALDYSYDNEKMDSFKKLISSVWQSIQALNFELDKEYDESYKGIQAFEDDLLK